MLLIRRFYCVGRQSEGSILIYMYLCGVRIMFETEPTCGLYLPIILFARMNLKCSYRMYLAINVCVFVFCSQCLKGSRHNEL